MTASAPWSRRSTPWSARPLGEGLDDGQQARLHEVEVQLDQCWDLLRQRRARRDAGQDPDTAHVRPEGTVEGYLQ